MKKTFLSKFNVALVAFALIGGLNTQQVFGKKSKTKKNVLSADQQKMREELKNMRKELKAFKKEHRKKINRKTAQTKVKHENGSVNITGLRESMHMIIFQGDTEKINKVTKMEEAIKEKTETFKKSLDINKNPENKKVLETINQLKNKRKEINQYINNTSVKLSSFDPKKEYFLPEIKGLVKQLLKEATYEGPHLKEVVKRTEANDRKPTFAEARTAAQGMTAEIKALRKKLFNAKNNSE